MRKEQQKNMKLKEKMKIDKEGSLYIWAVWIIARKIKLIALMRNFQKNIKKLIILKKTGTPSEDTPRIQP